MASPYRKFLEKLRRFFVGGLLVIIPIIATFIVLRFLFRSLDSFLGPPLQKLIGYQIPGIGILATLLLIFLAGFLTSNVVGSRLYGIGELFFIRTPLVRSIYSAAKQFMEAIVVPDKQAFERVVLVQYPRKGIYAIGFASGRLDFQQLGQSGKFLSVFVPSTPTPFTGFVILFPLEEVSPLDMSLEEAVKFIVSGGIASPDRFRTRSPDAISRSA